MNDFLLTPELAALRERVRAFVDTHVVPVEGRVLGEHAAGGRETLDGLQALARQAGLWTPHLPEAYGGLGLGVMGMCALFREMGRSPVGAKAFNCDAPDQGNMDLLLAAGSPEIRARYLAPLAAGAVTSAFCMTEPAPGAGADPTNLRTRAERIAGGWVLSGRKWFATGARDAAFLIVMARTSPDPREGATMFLVDRHAPGVRYLRDVAVMGEPLLHHVEGELELEDVQLGEEAVLGQPGEGFALAQRRLVPARLTHCMRWLGLADRTLEMCRAYLGRRLSFGKRLAEHQLVQQMVAENAGAIHAGNLMTLHCAWTLETGGRSQDRAIRAYSSMTKVHVARLLCKVLDDAIQMHGALGYSEDLPFGRWYRFARAARIADGPDEVHQVVVAREVLAGRLPLLV